MTITATTLAATFENLPERDLVALVAFRGLVQVGDPQAGFRAYELADDFLAAREGNTTGATGKDFNYTGDPAVQDDDDLPF